MVLALAHESPTTCRITGRLLDRLREPGETLAVFGDSEERSGPPDVRFLPLREGGRDLETEEARRQAAEWQDAVAPAVPALGDLPENGLRHPLPGGAIGFFLEDFRTNCLVGEWIDFDRIGRWFDPHPPTRCSALRTRRGRSALMAKRR